MTLILIIILIRAQKIGLARSLIGENTFIVVKIASLLEMVVPIEIKIC